MKLGVVLRASWWLGLLSALGVLLRVAIARKDEVVELSPVFTSFAGEMGHDLACSACAHVFDHLRNFLAHKVTPKSKKKDKRKLVKELFNDLCSEDRFPKQFAITGEMGKRTYEDFQKVMKGGGNIGNLNMKPENRENVVTLCGLILAELEYSIIRQATNYKGRLGGFNWERWACVKNLRICNTTIMHKTDEDLDEADEDGDGDESDL
mmetsp:Transcript_72315/g.172373  ORF Transcript_72315/g.172373 Transcript_72315/m.172373 type:complete len:208 (+) Transcript_72315:96-719(+)|eukprot:CAMPEP_0178420552 /NCGR_PEP_ID=MMETSP0689_2-20121128/26191_1 /TAXON_ID=160604 /ORGANISM="Amphidinium massartii, Strain CS-259" /LENGTH=207 /DNA_ID=CAMNT_0020042037 /DNA_START=96 /DNA_END=719 /DNA_ORIENTATION=-